MVFIHMPSFSLRYQGNGRIEDVHLFMRCLYRLWYCRGPWGCSLSSFVDFLNSLVLFAVIFFLVLLFDWSAALNCDEVSCGSVKLVHGIHSPTIFGMNHLVLGVVLLTSSFVAACYEFVMFLETVKLQNELQEMLCGIVDCGYITPVHRLLDGLRKMRARVHGHEAIHINGDLQFIGDMSWGHFLETVCERIQDDRTFGIFAYREFDSLRAIQALMVYDNYFIALHQHGVLEKGTLKYADDDLLKILICGMFDEFNTLKPGKDQLLLVRWQIVKYLIFYVLLYPFVITLSMVRVLVKNAAMIRSDWGNYMTRDWSNRAQWTFRLYNEVPHILSARLSAAKQIAVNMVLRLQPSSCCAVFFRRIASTIVCVTVGLSCVNPPLVISGSIGGISFVWWLSLALVMYSICSEKTPVCREYSYEADLENLTLKLHYEDKEWERSGERFYNAITRDFLKSRFYVILSDIAHTFFMPLILVGLLFDGSIPELVDTVFNESVSVDGLGSVSKGSVFEFQGDEEGDGEIHFSANKGKSAISIASFSSIYLRWSSKRIEAANTTKDLTDPNAQHTTSVDRFVKHLYDDMNAQHKLDQPPTSARGASYTAAADTTSEGFFQSVMWQQSNAHEREQMFVSQAMNLFPTESARFGEPSGQVSRSRMGREFASCESSMFQMMRPLERTDYRSSQT